MYTIEQYNTLKAAIAQGVTEVWYGDKKVVYRTLAEMLSILKLMEADLGLLTQNGGRKYATYDKGAF